MRNRRENRKHKLQEKVVSSKDLKAIAHDELNEILGNFSSVLPDVRPNDVGQCCADYHEAHFMFSLMLQDILAEIVYWKFVKKAA